MPLFFVLNMVTREAYADYIIAKQKLFTWDVFGLQCEESDSTICWLSKTIENYVTEPRRRYYLETTAQKISTFLIDHIYNFVFSIPALLISIFVMIFIMFFLFRDGEAIFEKLKRILPFKKSHKGYIFERYAGFVCLFSDILRLTHHDDIRDRAVNNLASSL